MNKILSSTATLFGMLIALPTQAQVGAGGYTLTLDLAIEAAREAVRSCEASGYKVSVVIVDPSGLIKVHLKGDHSVVHTKDTAFRKAYTAVTMGPIFNLETGTQFTAFLKTNPNASSFLTIPNIISLPGSIAIKAKGQIVGAIGVGGAPGGEKDEVCAQAGVTKIFKKLPK
ncbi:GlcG/HbpS family heme-binding protein [aff. Roholtiella sp. LEGE 12411]|uniref:GlcG/HbpS family heme-binding protein n=1 Tax=aff. Roholtiella sp. LEGE 12411 TaxID=1828822 RepID=UPI001882702C|nr:heme-binding protein [aff. Roholtiella sp. LEGE 12411]MBE9034182.1 heme-binding protein [aff. Roholtiella sp. LEGE 12411]